MERRSAGLLSTHGILQATLITAKPAKMRFCYPSTWKRSCFLLIKTIWFIVIPHTDLHLVILTSIYMIYATTIGVLMRIFLLSITKKEKINTKKIRRPINYSVAQPVVSISGWSNTKFSGCFIDFEAW